jgi:HD-like signal output (HDOD) protein
MSRPAADVGEAWMQDLRAALVAELERGHIQLPSWSMVTERVRSALARGDADDDELARLVGAEAGLAVRVLAVANSALLKRGGRRLSDLKLAIMRIGHDNLRSAVYAHALAQLRHAPRLPHLHASLQQLWHECTAVAALTRLIALRTGSGDGDAALLAGLLHNIGKVYILARLDDETSASIDEAARTVLLQGAHARIGALLAGNLQLGARVCQAIGEQEFLDAAAPAHSDLGAALAAAVIGASAPGPLAQTAAHLETFARFSIDAAGWSALIEKARSQSVALRATFGE